MEMTNVGNLLELRRIYSRGITGKGITTAVLDTGIYAHPDFFIPVSYTHLTLPTT